MPLQAKSAMISKTKEQILVCMGAASSKQKQGSIEVWKYYLSPKKEDTDGCEVNVVFSDGIVVNVKFLGNTGSGLSYGEQCGSC